MEISAFCQAAAELGETKFCKACAKSLQAALHFPEKQHPFPPGISASAQGYCNFFEKFFDFLVTNGILMCYIYEDVFRSLFHRHAVQPRHRATDTSRPPNDKR